MSHRYLTKSKKGGGAIGPTTHRVEATLPEYLTQIAGGFQIELGKVPLPTETYVADSGWLERDGSLISLFFGKRSRDVPEQLKSRVELRFSEENFLQLWTTSQEFITGLSNYVAELPPGMTPKKYDISRWKAEKDHTLCATAAMMARAGTQSEVDFFEIPVSDAFVATRFSDLTRLVVNSVLRVYLPTHELQGMFVSAPLIAKAIAADLPTSGVRP